MSQLASRAPGSASSSEPGPLDRLLASPSQRIGALHAVLVAVALGAGTLLALSLLFESAPDHLGALRAHGLVMTLLAVVPALPAVLGNLALPRVLGRTTREGAGELPFVALGWAGAVLHALALVAFAIGAQTGGTSVGVELHDAASRGFVAPSVVAVLLSLAFAAASSSLQAIRVLAAVLPSPSRRAPLAAGLGAASALLVLASPLQLALVAMTLVERALGVGLFDPTVGGDALLFAELSRVTLGLFLTSATLGALGVLTHVVEAHTRELAPGWDAATFVALAVSGALGGGAQVVSLGVSARAVLQTGPFDIVFHALVLSLVVRWVRRIRLGAELRALPLQFGLASLALLAIALPSGWLLALPSLGSFLEASSFATGRLHMLAVGGVLLALLAGLHEAWEPLTGAPLRRDRSTIGLVAIALGATLAFLPMLGLGLGGMPRPLPPGMPLAWLALAGAGLALMASGASLAGWNLLASLKGDDDAAQPAE